MPSTLVMAPPIPLGPLSKSLAPLSSGTLDAFVCPMTRAEILHYKRTKSQPRELSCLKKQKAYSLRIRRHVLQECPHSQEAPLE
jgi:hypothetical protein